MPAQKKHASTRARRNKTPGAATLTRRAPMGLVPADTSAYDDLTVAQLRGLIDERNAELAPDRRLSKGGTKAGMKLALATLDNAGPEIPSLPDRVDGWHELTRRWWDDVWASPMSDEWDDSDLHNLYLCAALYDDMWRGETAAERKNAASEFRLQRAVLGLDPYSRRRLEWQIEAAGEAKDRGDQRRRTGTPPAPATKGKPRAKDPRAALHAV